MSALEARYADLGSTSADGLVVVLDRRLRSRRVLRFDQRHLRAVAPLQGGSFELLPDEG